MILAPVNHSITKVKNILALIVKTELVHQVCPLRVKQLKLAQIDFEPSRQIKVLMAVNRAQANLNRRMPVLEIAAVILLGDLEEVNRLNIMS